MATLRSNWSNFEVKSVACTDKQIGFILKATAPGYFSSKPAHHCRVYQDGSNRSYRTGNSFNGRKALSQPPHKTINADHHSDGKTLEDAFWQGRPLKGRNITSMEVLRAYRNDRTSLRAGFFLQNLCLQNRPHNGVKITPDRVIEEFNRAPTQNNKCLLAKARFKAECCLRDLLLNGQLVTPDAVVNDYRAAKALLELARFKAECCLRGLQLNRRQVTPDAVVNDFPESPQGKLGIARFKAECCLRGLQLNGQEVTPDAVVKDFPKSPQGKLGKARFQEQCCLRGLLLNGQEVTPDAVVYDYRAIRAPLELARFKEQCCLKGLLLNGQQVTPDAVVNDYQATRASLELALFKAECCLKGLLLNGQQVTPDAVVNDFPESPEGKLGIARFKEQCCLRGLPLNGQQVRPDAVINDYRTVNTSQELARFKQQCCLRGLQLNGQQVTPDEVVNDFPESPEGKLGIARFKAECCLRGLRLNGQQVSADVVVNNYRETRAPLELARFKEECCLRGLLLNGQQITPDEVVNDFLKIPDVKLSTAHFKAKCFLRGLLLNGQQVTPDAVINDYRAAKAPLELARFKQQCCQRGLPLNGQQVTPDLVVNDFPKSPEGKLGKARFKAECCLRRQLLNGQQVTPDAAINDFPNSPEGKLGIARFKAECCLRGLMLNGQQVTPNAVINDYKQGGWRLEIAIFYSQLALFGKKLNGNYLNNHQVLAAFRKLPGDHSSRQANYLIQRLKTLPEQDETDDTLETFKQAWQILKNAPVKDDENRHQQCILRFKATEHKFPVDHQSLAAEQVLQTINNLRSSFKKTRLHFFFLAHCYNTNKSLDGQPVLKHQVLDCLQGLPARSKLRYALGCWFEELNAEANLLDELLLRRGNPSVIRGEGDSQQGCTVSARLPEREGHLPEVIPVVGSSGEQAKGEPAEKVEVFIPNLYKRGFLSWRFAGYYHETEQSGTAASDAPMAVTTDAAQVLRQLLNTGEPTASDRQVALLSSLTNKSLEMIQEVNCLYNAPVILITGSFARYLQGFGSSFNDIDIICTTEESASILIDKLITLNSDMDSAVHKKVVVWPICGCPEIRLPVAYNIKLVEGDLGTKTMGLQVSIDTRIAPENKDVAAVHLPGVQSPVRCLSFAAETRLISDNLEFLADQLDPLTDQLQKGACFDIPRTILFNDPKSLEERIYGLLMRCLLTLNKAKQFHSLLAEGKTGYWPEHYSTALYSTTTYSKTLYFKTLCRLQQLTDHMHAQLKNHSCRDHFVRRLEDWTAKNQHINDYGKKRYQFIKRLIEMVTWEAARE